MARSKKKEKTVDMAITELDFDTLMLFAQKNRNKKCSYSFHSEFKNRSDTQISQTISDLWKMLIDCMKKYLDGSGSTVKNWASSTTENVALAGRLIQATVDIALVTLQLKHHMTCHIELAVLLNGILSFMPDNLDSVKNSIAQYCEKVCLTKVCDNSEYFLYNVFPYLFHKTLGRKVLKTDIKRIYAIRKHLAPVMKFKETKKKEMWDYFKQILFSIPYLSILEGQKVIALTLTIDIDKIADMQNSVEKVLPSININYASAYGRIYFEAWCYSIKHEKLDLKEALELTCLQNLVEGAILSKNRMVLPITRKMLAEFNYHKKEQEVSEMLRSIYQPIIYRYLKNPNGLVRASATQLFLDIFPFEDTDFKVVQTQTILNQQLNMLRELLEDDFPIVRITTILAMCISLSVNWEVYPGETIKTYFKLFINDLARDSTNAKVRCAVVKGLKCLLENPLTLRCLIQLLPKLRHLFHDISEDVRIAFCQLLIRIKKISAIKYFDIVPPDHLLARLTEDCPTVQKSIVSLLSNSYFPSNQDSKLWLGRCLEILKTDRDASRVLFTHINHHVELIPLVNFMCQATQTLQMYIKTKSSGPAIVELCNKENIDNIEEYLNNLEEAVGFSNLKTVSALMDAIIIMWLSLKKKMEMVENKYYAKMFVSKIGSSMGDICLYYKDTEAWESVFYTASFLPPVHVPSLGSLCFWKLKNLAPDAKREEYLTLVECLCNQRQAEELLNLFKEWLEVGLSDSYVPPSAAKKRRRGRSGENIYFDQPKPYIANHMLDIILNNRCLQKCVISYPKALLEITYLFDYIKRKLERFNAKVITETEANFLGLLMYNILRILVFLEFHNEANGTKFINEIVEWTEKKLISQLTFSDEKTNDFISLIHTICMNLSRVLSDAAGLGFVDPSSRIPLLFFERLLTSELGYKYALIASRFLYKYTATCQYIYVIEDETIMYENLLVSFEKILKSFRNETLLQSIPTQDYRDVQFTLGNVMQILHNVVNVLVEPTATVFKCVLTSVLDSVLEKTEAIVEEFSVESFEKIVYPKVGAFFNFMVNQKPRLVATYMKFLTELYLSSSQNIPHWIVYWTIVYNILGKKELSRPILNETHILVFNMEKTLLKLFSKTRKSRSSSQEPRKQLFEQHCQVEFSKLKNRQLAKVAAVKLAESKKLKN